MKNSGLLAAAALVVATLACTAGAGGVTPSAIPAELTPMQTAAVTTPAQPATPPENPATEPPTVPPPTGAPAAQSFNDVCGIGSAALPSAPPRFADFAATILATLNAHSSAQSIDQGLRGWNAVTDKVGAVDALHDLTGDGAADLLVVVRAPADQFPNPLIPGPDGEPGYPGDLYIYSCSGGSATLLFGDYSKPDRVTPQLVTVADLNADKLNEIVYTTRNCGASTCFIAPHVIAWNASTQQFVGIFPANYAAPSGKMDITDVDGDGISEIVVHVGFQGSAGAGVQRSFDETYAWNGSQYALKTRVVTSPQYPIHYLNDADDATARGDFATAIRLYQQVIDDPSPKTFLNQDEIPALKAYARYRLMLAYALGGDTTNAQAAHDTLASQFANAPAGAPGASFAHFSDLFWNAYQSGHDAKAGCAPVIALAASNEDTYQILNNFGYANSFYKPENLCPAE